ncbi:MAG: TIGR04282 family arsenosugar biosynthesis glycosyltransferase [Deltaproteobacteria bacterium]
MTKDAETLVVVFARLPEAGRVKTRLARTLGDALTADLYAAFITDLLAELSDGPWSFRVAVAGEPAAFAARFGLAAGVCVAQSGEGLGARMEAAFCVALEQEGFARCILVGSDLPQLARAPVAQAAAALALGASDLVLGPALDGGYYLIAMARPQAVFADIPWSTAAVLARTRERARGLGLRCALLDEDFDIDTEADLMRLEEWLGSRPATCLPATRAALRRATSWRSGEG